MPKHSRTKREKKNPQRENISVDRPLEKHQAQQLLLRWIESNQYATIKHYVGKGKLIDDCKDLPLGVLHAAVKTGKISLVKFFVKQMSVDVNSLFFKETPLHVAAERKFLNIVEHLCDHGADVNVKDSSGDTPLLNAVSQGYLEIVKVLVVKFGADINVQNRAGNSPLHRAVINDDEAIVDYLVQLKAKVDAKNEDGNTPLHIAVTKEKVVMTYLILKSEPATVEEVNNQGRTALHLAAEMGRKDVVRMLITEFWANIEALDNFGRTPLHFAATYGHKNVMDLLKSLGASDIKFDKKGRTPEGLYHEFCKWVKERS